MSSYYTTISCDEWQRMQDSIQDSQAYVIRNAQEIARIKQLEEDQRRQFEEIRQRNMRAIERAVDVITLTGRSAINNMNSTIEQTTVQNGNEILHEIDTLRRSAANAQFRISQVSDNFERIANQYNAATNAIINQETGDAARANSILSEFDNILEEIRSLNPGSFIPQEYAALEESRRAIASDISSNNYQAALMLSQGSIIMAARALAELITYNDQYEHSIVNLQDELESIQRRINELSSSEGRISIDMGDGEYETDYDINYWSDGRFNEIVSGINTISQQINSSDGRKIPLNKFPELMRTISNYMEQLDACDSHARERLASSLEMENTANRMYDNLTGRGFELDDSGWIDGERKNPYTMTYDDGTGNTLSIVIAPGSDPTKPSFAFEAFSENEGMANLVKDGVQSALGIEGLNTENTVHREDCGENKDPETFINRAIKETNIQRQIKI